MSFHFLDYCIECSNIVERGEFYCEDCKEKIVRGYILEFRPKTMKSMEE